MSTIKSGKRRLQPVPQTPCSPFPIILSCIRVSLKHILLFYMNDNEVYNEKNKEVVTM